MVATATNIQPSAIATESPVMYAQHGMGEVGPTLERLESFYGRQEPSWPTDPYEFLIWWHSGYPASDAACAKGWLALNRVTKIAPPDLLHIPTDALAGALAAGGMVPELRAMRLKEIALRVQDQYGGDLRAALTGPIPKIRKLLKSFPNIADPGADRILLFGGLAPTAAVPSNTPHVLIRILHGQERENYGVNYRQSQDAIASEIPETFDARQRAYLLVKRHGQEICKRTNPKCDKCPVNAHCAFFTGKRRGRAAVR